MHILTHSLLLAVTMAGMTRRLGVNANLRTPFSGANTVCYGH